MYLSPTSYIGCCGCLVGVLLIGPYMWYTLIKMIIVIIDRIGVNIANNIFGKNWLYFINRRAQGNVYRDMSSVTATSAEISDASKEDVMNARKIAIHVRRIFDGCNPKFYGDHWHYKEVKVDELAARVSAERNYKLKWLFGDQTQRESGMLPFLTDEELEILQKRFIWAKTRMDTISFCRFCLFIGEALHCTRKFLKENEEDDEERGSVWDRVNMKTAPSQVYEN